MQIANVDRCLSLIEMFAGSPESMSPGALAERLDRPKSATHRLLQTLATRRYVNQDAASQDHAVSLKVALLGFRYLDAPPLSDVAQEALDRLAQDCGEHCRICPHGANRVDCRSTGAPDRTKNQSNLAAAAHDASDHGIVADAPAPVGWRPQCRGTRGLNCRIHSATEDIT